jgi:hypothetical protein
VISTPDLARSNLINWSFWVARFGGAAELVDFVRTLGRVSLICRVFVIPFSFSDGRSQNAPATGQSPELRAERWK